MSNNEFYAHKHSDKIKWVIAFILIAVLLAGMVGAWAILLTGRETISPDEVTEEETESGGANITAGEENGITLTSYKISLSEYEEYGVSLLAETAYALTATITPSNATNRAVDWTIAFANASASWVSGKTVTDYVILTPTSDGALTATVECLQAFGEQIFVTVTSRDNISASATATVDYTQKLQGVTATFGSTTLTNGMTKTFDLDASGQSSESWTFDYTTSDCTIADSYTTTVTIAFNSTGLSSLESALSVSFTWTGETITSGMPAFDKTFFDTVFVTANGAVSDDAELYNELVDALSSGVTLFDVTVSATGTYGSDSTTYAIIVSSSGMDIRVQGISIDRTEIIF